MPYKTLLAHLDLDETDDGRARLAADLAKRFGAALIGVSGWAPSPSFSGDTAVIETPPEVVDLEVMEDLLKTRGDAFREIATRGGVEAEWRSALALPTELVVQEAGGADLLIVGATHHPVLRDPYRMVDPGAVLLRAGRPILLVPPAVASLSGKRIAIAWKDTREARRAVSDALPFLEQADSVAVVEFGDDADPSAAEHGQADLLNFLARHGVRGTGARTMAIAGTVGESLFRLIRDEAVDLIVAGGYGHSRLGEAVFGGLTRDLLTGSPVCCLLSH
jgi:nucleotide-binding universal stress UspA family protein